MQASQAIGFVQLGDILLGRCRKEIFDQRFRSGKTLPIEVGADSLFSVGKHELLADRFYLREQAEGRSSISP
jgi:hypothetical protein